MHTRRKLGSLIPPAWASTTKLKQNALPLLLPKLRAGCQQEKDRAHLKSLRSKVTQFSKGKRLQSRLCRQFDTAFLPFKAYSLRAHFLFMMRYRTTIQASPYIFQPPPLLFLLVDPFLPLCQQLLLVFLLVLQLLLLAMRVRTVFVLLLQPQKFTTES